LELLEDLGGYATNIADLESQGVYNTPYFKPALPRNLPSIAGYSTMRNKPLVLLLALLGLAAHSESWAEDYHFGQGVVVGDDFLLSG
jgi:hypothetical protein